MSGPACVFSGGGAKAAAQIGAHRALEQRDIHPTRYVATSMGAVVAACFAAGLSYDEVLNRVARIERKDVAALSPGALLGFWSSGLLRAEPLREAIRRTVQVERFADLQLPLTVTATDLKTGALELFGAGGRDDVGLIDALYASCALPIYYPHAEIDGRAFVDGGLRAVLPLDVAARFDPAWIFAVNVGSSFEDAPAREGKFPPPVVRAHGETLRIMMSAQTEELLRRWRTPPVPLVLVHPPLAAETTFALHRAREFYEVGYRAAVTALDEQPHPS